jgi:hypothetical protein
MIGARPLTKTERQRRWREGKRLAQAVEPEPKPEPAPELARSRKPDPIVIRPTPVGTRHGQYGHIVRATLAAVDALPQPHVALLDVIQKLMREYDNRR